MIMNPLSLDKLKIMQAISAAESQTSGEIRVVIYPHAIGDPVETARQEFVRLAMHHTRERNAVLVLVAPAARAFAIYGDRGVHAQCGDRFWEGVAETMRRHFMNGEYTAGVVAAVKETGAVLAQHFPRRPDDRNELPDDVVERGTVI